MSTPTNLADRRWPRSFPELEDALTRQRSVCDDARERDDLATLDREMPYYRKLIGEHTRMCDALDAARVRLAPYLRGGVTLGQAAAAVKSQDHKVLVAVQTVFFLLGDPRLHGDDAARGTR